MKFNMTISNSKKKTEGRFAIGKTPIRKDGYDKVSGKALYGADIFLPGQLYGKILRSPYAHAEILSIDTSEALKNPEVRAIITNKNFPIHANESVSKIPGPPINLFQQTDNILASEKVLYKGHPIVALAATSIHAAEEAISQIKVEYKILKHASNVEEAMSDKAELLHIKYNHNIADQNTISIGDVEEGFKNSDVIVEKTFKTATVHQGYIEPHSATAIWASNNQLTIWGSSQGHFQIRDRTSLVLGIPYSSIKVIPLEIGGGFGGKTTIYLEPIVAMLSKHTGSPVKITMTRSEVLEATGPTSGSFMKIKMGALNNGTIISAKADLYFEAGAYPGSPVGAASNCIFTPYSIDNLLVNAFDIVTNKPKTTAYRAPGAPIGAFGAESIVDELAVKLNIDPIQIRFQNGADKGTTRINGITNPVIGYKETLISLKDHEHYSSPKTGKHVGRGIASGFWVNGSGPACAIANVNYDGTISLTIGSMDIGGLRPVASQHVSEVLGVPTSDIIAQVGDTDTIGYTSMTGGSGGAFKTGWASYEAAQDIKRQMLERAAEVWECSLDDVFLENGTFQNATQSDLSLTFKELSAHLPDTGGPVVGRANLDPRGPGSAFATHLVDLEVDVETGKITILRYTASQDVGKAIHPNYVEGQIQGGVVQGIGWALNEEYYMNLDGSMSNSSLLDYRMPTSLDLPMIETILVETPNPLHPFGVRGVGEVPIVPPMGAIANAIYDAIGIRITQLPMNPSSIINAINQNS
jgi:xanthine dehydrogenase molybdenum-binding subunit